MVMFLTMAPFLKRVPLMAPPLRVPSDGNFTNLNDNGVALQRVRPGTGLTLQKMLDSTVLEKERPTLGLPFAAKPLDRCIATTGASVLFFADVGSWGRFDPPRLMG